MTVDELAALLKEAGHAHHEAFASTEGDDPEWATWYADYLQQKLSAFFGREISQAEIAQALTTLDERYRAHKVDTGWPAYYAQALVELWS